MDPEVVYIILNAFSNTHVEALRRECDSNASLVSKETLCDRACAIDLFEDSVLSDSSFVRESIPAYMNER